MEVCTEEAPDKDDIFIVFSNAAKVILTMSFWVVCLIYVFPRFNKTTNHTGMHSKPIYLKREGELDEGRLHPVYIGLSGH